MPPLRGWNSFLPTLSTSMALLRSWATGLHGHMFSAQPKLRSSDMFVEKS